MATDPGPIADDLCEVVFHGDPKQQLDRIALQLRLGEGVLDDVLAEVDRRDGLLRLLPTSPSEQSANILRLLIDGLGRDDGFALLAGAFVRRGGDYSRIGLSQLLTTVIERGFTAGVFARLIAAGRYESFLQLLTSDGTTDGTVLRALASARPDYGSAQLNAPALAAKVSGDAPYDALIIPGFTPTDATRPMTLSDLPAAVVRLERALSDFKEGRAPLIIPSGGAVHPAGTPHVEALLMRDWLVARGVPADRVLVDPFARHSTTNLRNAGRLMLGLGLRKGLVVTGGDAVMFDQAFYLGFPTLSSFSARCAETLGYVVGELGAVGEGRVEFRPSMDVNRPNWADPLDW